MAFSDICLGISDWERLSNVVHSYYSYWDRLSTGSFLIHSYVHIDSQKQKKVSLALSDINLAQKWGQPHFVTEITGIAAFYEFQMVLSSSMTGGVSLAKLAKTHL